jgi:hypothetical protein
MASPLSSLKNYAEQAFPDLNLGDQRLNRRFAQVIQASLQHPEKSLPDKFHDPAAYFACLRLLNHPALTHGGLLCCHQTAVLDRLEGGGPAIVLLLHDTTDLDFSGQASLAGSLGQIGNGGGKGYLCHNSLALAPHSQEILGLVNQILHCRPYVGKKEPVARKRERDSRESRLWLRAIDAIGPSPTDKLWVDVCDRGADLFEFLQALLDRRRHFVVRSSHNRALTQPQDQDRADVQMEVVAEHEDTAAGAARPGTPTAKPPHLLHDFMRTLPAAGTWGVDVAATPTRRARVALVQASASQVKLKPPHVRKGEYRKETLTLGAIRVWEPLPPKGEEPLEWLLLTDQEVSAPEALRRVVSWYENRWVVEEFHKGQKTGVGIERLQLQDAGSLQVAIVLLSVVAIALVNLRVATRDREKASRPASEYVPELWVRVLSIQRYQQIRSLTVLEFSLALARLGGHLNRKSDGLPGWITLWRGWERLHTMIEYELSRSTCV